MFSTPPTTTRTGRMAYAESRCPNSCLSPPPPLCTPPQLGPHHCCQGFPPSDAVTEGRPQGGSNLPRCRFSSPQASPGSCCPTSAPKVPSFGVLLLSLHINAPEFLLRPFQRHTFSRAFAGGFCRSIPGKNLRTGHVSLNPDPVLSSWVVTEKPALQNGIEMDM